MLKELGYAGIGPHYAGPGPLAEMLKELDHERSPVVRRLHRHQHRSRRASPTIHLCKEGMKVLEGRNTILWIFAQSKQAQALRPGRRCPCGRDPPRTGRRGRRAQGADLALSPPRASGSRRSRTRCGSPRRWIARTWASRSTCATGCESARTGTPRPSSKRRCRICPWCPSTAPIPTARTGRP